jgi:hypothetical protein
VFVDFVGPMVRSRAGNQAIFVILDGFSKFVAMYPVRRITTKVVVDILLKRYIPTFGLPNFWSQIMRLSLGLHSSFTLVFLGVFAM